MWTCEVPNIVVRSFGIEAVGLVSVFMSSYGRDMNATIVAATEQKP